jgi:hypothetical protein
MKIIKVKTLMILIIHLFFFLQTVKYLSFKNLFFFLIKNKKKKKEKRYHVN